MTIDRKTTSLDGTSDLTVVARIKPGFVPGTTTGVQYTERLFRVLSSLNAVRKASREAALLPNPFPELIGRFRGIHFFRFSILPSAGGGQPAHLLLNVTFDGGWEPYMRVIWGPLGTLLDLIFCHCEEYPLAHVTSFDDYIRWVRRNEVPSQFFYSDSAATVADMHYLRQLEEQQRRVGGTPGADAAAAALALPGQPAVTAPSRLAVEVGLRLLSVYAGLRDTFPEADDERTTPPFRQDIVLLRFIQDLLPELRDWVNKGLFKPGGNLAPFAGPFGADLQWLARDRKEREQAVERLSFDPADVQAGIESRYPEEVRHGALVLLAITNVELARSWLANTPVTPAASIPLRAGDIYSSVALSFSGLRRLEVPQVLLDRLPQEFVEGMEHRAGVLGDVRGNHPEHWHRPRRNWPQPLIPTSPEPPAIELGSVHVLIQLRTDQQPSPSSYGGSSLPSNLVAAIDQIDDATTTGMSVLHVQPMFLSQPVQGAAAGRDAFGFVDGLSQPTVNVPEPSRTYWRDNVERGDLFLGYGNSRGDGPAPSDELGQFLDNGSFLVVRKLQQFPELLNARLGLATGQLAPGASPFDRGALIESLKAKLMGRRTDGTPLVPTGAGGSNDFDYRQDGDGARCPFQAHIRRANPRERLPLRMPPRIARRGMSYRDFPPAGVAGPAEVGLVFMAYNASIAEQFEVIQRWLTGGNSSGLSADQSDPMLGVPQAGQPRVYRFVDQGKVVRVDLGDQPLVRLEWGLYAFVPSIAALKQLAAPQSLPAKEQPAATRPGPLSALEGLRMHFESERERDAAWAGVRQTDSGVKNAEPYGLLVARSDRVLEVLKDPGNRFSVSGYGRRMTATVGQGFLGMDDVGNDDGHQDQAPGVNQIIENYRTEAEAFVEAFAHAIAYLDAPWQQSPAAGGPPTQAPVDLVAFSRTVIAHLCSDWFGLPDAGQELMKHAVAREDATQDGFARCPGHQIAVSRFIFGPHPMPAAVDAALLQGPLIRSAVRRLLQDAADGKRSLTPLVKDISSSPGLDGDFELQVSTVAGVMIGFPATVIGNLVTVLRRWVESRRLWDLQQAVPIGRFALHAEALRVLRPVLIDTMRQAPVPPVVWRTAMADGSLGVLGSKAGHQVIVGLAAAVARDPNSPSTLTTDDAELLMFGGSRSGPNRTTHGCPGHAMAIGVMLGGIAALLGAGTLRPSANPLLVTLSKP